MGWDSWEEIERIPTPPTSVLNFGWPCYEGPAPQPAYQIAGLSSCSNLSASNVTGAYFNYSHTDEVSLDDGCPTTQGSVVSGIGFYGGTSYPSAYRGALFFADHSRECIWEMPLGANGEPDPTRVQPFVNEAANPVDIQSGHERGSLLRRLRRRHDPPPLLRRPRRLRGRHLPRRVPQQHRPLGRPGAEPL